MGHAILIDGYNVIKNNIMFQMAEARSLADARTLLIKQLQNRYRHSIFRVIVVFDGSGAREQVTHDEHICIVFSRFGETADSVIARMASEANTNGHTITLYSDDGEVQEDVIEQGGRFQTTHQLTSHLNAPPRDVAIRTQHRQTIRRIYDIDPSYKPEPEDELPSHPQTRKKKKKHHR